MTTNGVKTPEQHADECEAEAARLEEWIKLTSADIEVARQEIADLRILAKGLRSAPASPVKRGRPRKEAVA